MVRSQFLRGFSRMKRCCSASTTTRLPRQLITRTPVSHPISSFETVMTCSRRPVAGFTFSLSLVCDERWNGVMGVDWLFMSLVHLGCVSAMTEVSFFCSEKASLAVTNY